MFADVIVDDQEDHPFMLVEVKASVDSAEIRQEFIEQLDRSDAAISFGMLVDLENIHLFKRESPQGTFIHLVSLKTSEILRHYDSDFAGKDSRYTTSSIFHDYFTTLVEGWLRDLAYRWKTADPPAPKALSVTGLFERIKNGMTRRIEVAAVGSPLESASTSWKPTNFLDGIDLNRHLDDLTRGANSLTPWTAKPHSW